MFETGPSAHYLYGEAVTLAALVGSFMDYIPRLAALVAVVWYVILIIESRTGSAILARLKIKRAEVFAQSELHARAAEAAETIKEQAEITAHQLKGDHTP
jgi:hypothetical protein